MTTKFIWEDSVYKMLTGSPQDYIWHAEGDVAIHTRMVTEEMLGHEGFSSLPEVSRDLLHRTALLHDIGKPSCTQHEDGRIRNRGHARAGAVLSRGLLYGEGYDPVLREHLCALVRSHTTPMHAMKASDEEVRATVLKASLMLRCDYLTMLAEADNRGRTTPESKEPFISNIGYFAELAKDQECFEQPYPFKSDHSKFLYFQSGGTRDPAYLAHDDTEFEMVMMAGFPGTGKDTWIKKHYSNLPMISLDEIRKDLKVPSGVNQSPVIIKAKERFKELLRKKQSFVFNATSLNADLRLPWIGLAAQYNARIRIVYLEVPLPELLRRNKTREESARLPESVIYKMMAKWSMPHPSEAHVVEYHYGGQS